ncbi:hypothetical protein BC828DRAFT_333254, partial [Blastocladiella britannica]
YGSTENTAIACVQLPGDWRSGNVGPMYPSCEIKLESVPEMNYTAHDKPYPRGEICMRGPTVALGYFKEPEKTRETFDEDGWLHTGDIGLLTEVGAIKIIDRKKALFKLSQGEYVSPDSVENVLALNPLVAQAFVHGDSLQSHLVCVVVPNPDALAKLAATVAPSLSSFADQCAHPQVRAAVLQQLQATSRAKKLNGFETVRAVFLDPHPFSVENGLLTPSFKLKRSPQAVEHYRKQIDDMY